MLTLTALASAAAAYPQLQLSTGATRCSECHVAPSGGGLLTDYGRGEVGDTISLGGDGALLHGAWAPPSWLALGGDVRLALGGKQLDGEAAEVLAFPMQADLYARAALGPVSLNLTVGGNGAARGRPAGATALNYLASRQHYLAYQPDGAAWSVRAGRFFPTLGVRTQDHTAYPRRHLDMYLLEEPYALEGTLARGRWELFASAFVGNPIPATGGGAGARGGTAYAERLIADGEGALAGQARVTFGPADHRYLVGAVAKRWLAGPKLMALAEVDLQRQTITDGGFTRYQLVGYLGVTRVMLPGYLVGVAVQRFAPDVSFGGTTRNALELNLQAFPWAHVEAHLLGRAEATGGDTTHPNLLALLQLHYYL
ncbi:MAG: hypothetical protein IPL61_31345 [Myxococcales bacterium]|nr:hypothetical protein [Myxococcales bacterium]